MQVSRKMPGKRKYKKSRPAKQDGNDFNKTCCYYFSSARYLMVRTIWLV